MKQITQKELIELIKEKQENAKNSYESASRDSGYRSLEESKTNLLIQVRNKAYINAYEDLICYLNSVEIVTTIPKAKQDLQRIPELEAKAKAFDVLSECAFPPYRDKHDNIALEMRAFSYLTKEEYEILKKAGLE